MSYILNVNITEEKSEQEEQEEGDHQTCTNLKSPPLEGA